MFPHGRARVGRRGAARLTRLLPAGTGAIAAIVAAAIAAPAAETPPSTPIAAPAASPLGRSPAAALEGWALRPARDARAPSLGWRGAPLPGARAEAFPAGALGVEPGALRLIDRRPARALTHLHYAQFQGELPVEGAGLLLSLDRSGAPIAFRSTLVAAPAAIDTHPRLPGDAAIRLAARRIAEATELPGASPGLGDAAGETRLDWERPTLALRVEPGAPDSSAALRLIWRLRGLAPDRLTRWTAAVDARDGEVLEARPLLLGLEGEVAGRVRHPNPWGEELELPFPDLLVEARAGGEILATTYTDSLGRFSMEQVPGGAADLRLPLAGRFAEIRRGEIGADPAEILLSAPADSARIVWDDAAASPAEREAYLHLQRSRAWLRRMDPEFDAPLLRLDRPVPVVVEDASLDCNAIAHVDPETPWLSFSPAGEGCADLGRIASVVAHEYGHLITMYAYAPEEAPGFMQEGCSDYFAAALSDSPLVGLDWNGPGTWVRDLREPLYYPVHPYCDEDPYCAGGVLATALWELRGRLRATYADTLFHFMRAGKPADFDGCLLQLLLQDDDDMDLSNGTPRLAEIAGAFAAHGLGNFDLTLAHVPLADTAASPGARRAALAVGCIYPPDPGRMRAHVRVDGGPFRALAMSGSGYAYEIDLPGAPDGARIDYYFTAADVAGHEGQLPAGAPSVAFSYRLGPDETPPEIAHLAAAPPLSHAPRFWVQAGVYDNAGGIDSVWVSAECMADPERPGAPAVTRRARLFPRTLLPQAQGGGAPLLPEGYQPYEGALDLTGLPAGCAIRYRLAAVDRAGNERAFPADAPRSLLLARGWGEDFEVDEGGMTLDGGWERADPGRTGVHGCAQDPEGARAADPPLSGTAAWPSGRFLLACRPVDAGLPAKASATSPPRDLTGWSRATLTFWSAHRFAGADAGGRVLASRDGGESWAPVSPLGGYPDLAGYDNDGDGSADFLVGAFAGAPEGGRWWRVPLDGYAGDTLLVRWEAFGAQAGDTWWIDDPRLVDETLLPPPLDLTASQGMPASIRLGWRPPVEAQEDPLAYQIFRGEIPLEYAESPVATVEAPALAWTDAEVIPGRSYHYALRALYARGASPLCDEAIGSAYAARAGLPEEIASFIPEGDCGHDTLSIANLGDGELRISLYCGEAGASWASARVAYRLGDAPPGGYRTLLEDPAEGLDPDLSRLSVREASGNLIFRVETHAALPDPREDFTLLLFLDTDLAPGTGLALPNLGADRIVAVGRQVYRATDGLALGYVYDPDWRFIERTAAASAWEGDREMEFAVRRSALGDPAEIACALAIAVAEDAPPTPPGWDGDLAPDPPDLSWLSYEPRSGSAAPGAPLPVVFTYDLRGHPLGTRRARVFVATNDAALPQAELPLAVRRGAQEALTTLRLRAPWPSPSSAETRLSLEIPGGRRWRMVIVDAAGRLVRTLGAGGPEDPEIRLFTWDGRTEEGTSAASGRYYAVALSGDRRSVRPLILVR